MDSEPSTAPNPPKISFTWKATECILKQRPVLPTRRIPNDLRQLNSVVIDRENSPLTDGQIFRYFENSAVGASFRPKQKWLQLFFDDEDAAVDVITQGPHTIEGHTLPLFPPKGQLPPRFVMQLGNLPITN